MIEITYTDTREIDQKLTALAVKFAREELGLSQAELAKQMGCTKIYIKELELGKGNLTEAKVERLGKALAIAKHKQEVDKAHVECIAHFKMKPTPAERGAFVAGWLSRGEME